MTLTQISRPIEITTPLGDNVLLFHRMTATEELGGLFEFDLDLLSTNPDIKFEKILGQNVTIRLTLPDEKERFFNGFVTQFRLEGSMDKFFNYSMTVHPWLWFLTRTSDCRIFQKKTIPEIIKEVFREHKFTDFEESLGKHRVWEYCVQYRETDFNFVSRLMEQEGIYYYFKHEKKRHVLVLSDSITSHAPYPGYKKLSFNHHDMTTQPIKDCIYDWNVSQEIKPGTYALNEYDFTRPKANLQVKSTVSRDYARANMEIYDYPGEYPDETEGQAYARARIQALHMDQEIAHAQGDARGISVGSLFELTNHPRKDQNREYLIISATHQLESDTYMSGGASDSGSHYTCSFNAIPSKNPFRSTQRTPKPAIQGPQTAMVVGPSGNEIHTDKYGRVKVQFHWDRYGKKDENSSCWVRVSHPTAGKGWGSVQIPRIGQEVIVEFFEGDPDRPIITGRVYNNDNMPPYKLPENATQSGFKSRTSKGGGLENFNEIRFEDKKGEEQIYLQAEKNVDNRIKNDLLEWVGNDTHLIVKNNQFEQIDGDKHLIVKGDRNEKVDGTVSLETVMDLQEKVGMKHAIDAGMEIHLKAGMNVVLEAGMSITLKAGGGFIVVGPAGVTISGTPVLINSGGSAGSGSGCSPQPPEAPLEADKAKVGEESHAQVPPPPLMLSPQAQTFKTAAISGTPFCDT